MASHSSERPYKCDKCNARYVIFLNFYFRTLKLSRTQHKRFQENHILLKMLRIIEKLRANVDVNISKNSQQSGLSFLFFSFYKVFFIIYDPPPFYLNLISRSHQSLTLLWPFRLILSMFILVLRRKCTSAATSSYTAVSNHTNVMCAVKNFHENQPLLNIPSHTLTCIHLNAIFATKGSGLKKMLW